jgi:uncharacterized protein (TIGR02001 family)
MWEKGSNACMGTGAIARLLLLGAASLCLAPRGVGADGWGGSIGLTSDYFVRGISRSDGQPALQGDLHFSTTSGFFGGLFASTVQIDPYDPRNVELSGFLGFAWSASDDWHQKIVLDHYSYPWNQAGSKYDYDELTVDAAYQDWLDFAVVYSPNAPRYVSYAGLFKAAAESVEVNLQSPRRHRLAATAGVGYSYESGADAAGYVYWSVGADYDLAPVSLSLSYIDTTAAAKALFYNEAARGHWAATLIWRF